MKNFILSLFIFLPLILHGQKAVLSTGDDATGSGGTASYSVGQVAYIAKGAGITQSEGVQQAFRMMTIANDDANGDGTADIADPCDCTDPLNLDPNIFLGPSGGEVFHELVTVTSGSGETWTMDATTTGALDATGAALALPATMTEISPGVYTLDFYHEINIGYAGDFSNGAATQSIGNTCTISCLVNVPTLGEWGLIILSLSLLNICALFLMGRKKQTGLAIG